MALPPLPANTTNRLFLDYQTGTAPTSQEHTVAVRYNTVGAEATVQLRFLGLLQAIGAARIINGWRVIRARRQPALAEVSFPVDVIPELASFTGTTSGTLLPSNEALEFTFQGRSFTSGRRVDLSLYGLTVGVPANFRLTAAQAPWTGDAANFLTDTSNNDAVFVTIDGTPANWYPYTNANFNSYWERRIRLS